MLSLWHGKCCLLIYFFLEDIFALQVADSFLVPKQIASIHPLFFKSKLWGDCPFVCFRKSRITSFLYHQELMQVNDCCICKTSILFRLTNNYTRQSSCEHVLYKSTNDHTVQSSCGTSIYKIPAKLGYAKSFPSVFLWLWKLSTVILELPWRMHQQTVSYDYMYGHRPLTKAAIICITSQLFL